jgi:predicted transcriptional regulator of viral defense system
VRSGNWLRVDRGLFRLAEWVPGVHDDLARWTLWSLGRGVISHESALAVHDIGEFESSRVHITAPPPFRMRDDAVIIHIANLSPTDIQDRTGFRVTTPTRSIIDMAAQSPDEDQLARAIDDGVRAGLVNIRRLRGWSEVVDPRAALYIERALAMTRRQ